MYTLGVIKEIKTKVEFHWLTMNYYNKYWNKKENNNIWFCIYLSI